MRYFHQVNDMNQWKNNMVLHSSPITDINKQKKYRKPATDMDSEYWCETCDRGFFNLNQLDKHKQQHQKCNIDGCQFIAHPKVITKHIQMQHSSGLYKKIAKLVNPEEIKKWIEERKKKYPTKLNIEKKQCEVKEKIERGEKLGLPGYRHKKPDTEDTTLKRRHKYRGEKVQSHKKLKKNYECKTKANNVNVISSKTQALMKGYIFRSTDVSRKLKPFAGIQNINMESDTEELPTHFDCDFVIDDEVIDKECSSVTDVQYSNESTVCGALSTIISNYVSSDDDDTCKDDKEHDINNKSNNCSVKLTISAPKVNKKLEIAAPLEEKSNECNKSDDDSGPEEIKNIKNSDADITSKQESHNGKVNSTKKKLVESNNLKQMKKHFHKQNIKLPSTLLQKLLNREIQHERNVVLQCIRYIVKNNYFDK